MYGIGYTVKGYRKKLFGGDPEDEATLKDTVEAALQQIENKQYEAALVAKGFTKEKIRKYGFAFEGKKVLIG